MSTGVVGLVQKVLQMYAALALKVNSPDQTEVALNQVSGLADFDPSTASKLWSGNVN